MPLPFSHIPEPDGLSDQISKLFGKWFKVYRDEIGLFLWSAAILFLIHGSNILFNNFAETAFLKRYGVFYLPIITAVTSVLTFFVMGFLSGLMLILPMSRLLTYVLLFCGGSVAALRLLIPLDLDLLYPVLYVLKTQYEVLLGLLFWNLANDLFNTRQSKRIFPLITAGGITGGIIGSFGTPFLAKVITLDNLMLAYLMTTLAGAIAVKRMGTRYPSSFLSNTSHAKGKKRTTFVEELKGVFPVIKESNLLKILILLTLLPNIVIPIMNYQFSYIIDRTFATEQGMISFYGYFRGIQNVIALFISLLAGRIYGRFGLPVALMFHPLNYMLVFFSFLFRFDIFSAMYARLSTAVLRNTINAPARAILLGLFPEPGRALIRPFLRGTVVRVGILLGSGFILISQAYMHPKYLSFVALVFSAIWIGTVFYLKRIYPEILTDIIGSNTLNIKALDPQDVLQIFRDKKMESPLTRSFLSAHGEACLWYGRLLKSLRVNDLDDHILFKLRQEDDRTRTELLSLLSSQAGKKALPVFLDLIDITKPDLMVAFAKAAKSVYPDMPLDFQKGVFEAAKNPEVRAYALIGLYCKDPHMYKMVIDSWLNSKELPERRAGVLAAGESESYEYVKKLKLMLHTEKDISIVPLILRALDHLGTSDLNELTLPYLSHSSETVRLSALATFKIADDNDAKILLGLMGDPSDRVRNLAIERLKITPRINARLLVESLAIPGRRVRNGLFELAESLDIKDGEFFRFFRSQLESGYRNLAEAEALRHFYESPERDLLIDHLHQRKELFLENVLRALAILDRSGRMEVIRQGLSSGDSRQQSNSLEALENFMDRSMSGIMMPLLENLSVSKCLAVGKKHFKLPNIGSDTSVLFPILLADEDWLTVALTLNLINHSRFKGIEIGIIKKLGRSQDKRISPIALSVLQWQRSERHEEDVKIESGINIPDMILHLRGIQIFCGLSVSEMASVASVTEEAIYPPGRILINKGDIWNKLYLIVSGEVSVVECPEGHGDPTEELYRIGAGECVGEMALFDDVPRSVSIQTTEESRFLVLHKQAFEEMVQEYPEIAISICKDLSARLRKLHHKIQPSESSP
jgi:CRP-like cAMP-binding protein